ncbi:TetR/AcrR family transcriptional regulator [Streptomyces sp. WELS2]|uniref:TetR/AcrR family transcriptional regulator n=1 Tax=Streptomyces sp. WELS2 TaxID=2749435 RepID=UPI0015F0D707|nr:TetR/AcrR family transcriptional regulator [Streptomyces sp. WELS2]
MRQPSDEQAGVTTRRGRNKERARKRVYASALTLFRRQGYAQTSVAQIAEHADIARGSFFNYFPRKDALICAWMKERTTALTRRLGSCLRCGMPVAESLGTCMSVLGALNEEDLDLSMAMLTGWVQAGRPLGREPHLDAVFAEIVECGRARGEIHATLDPGQVGELLRDLYIGVLCRWAGRPPSARHSLGADLQEALDLLLHGIATPGGPHRGRRRGFV